MAGGLGAVHQLAHVGTLRSFRHRPFLWLLVLATVVLVAAQPGACDPMLHGYRPLEVNRNTDNGSFVLVAGENYTLELYGSGLWEETTVEFTADSKCPSRGCLIGNPSVSNSSGAYNGSVLAVGVLFESVSGKSTFYFCLEEDHQGDSETLTVVVVPPPTDLIPLPVEILLILVLMALSGLFSGLNLGLMALDPTILKIIMESGSKKQRGYAKTIYRVRKHGNYLLCTLLLGNVLVNSTLTVLLDNVLGSGAYAIVSSTIAIVIFGEIIPQAICSRHGLFIGAHTIWLTYIFMVVTLPLALPISLILNLILGKEIGSVYNREQLLELLKIGKHDLEHDEVDIISGALEFKKKTVSNVMTKFEDIYCLDVESVLDFRTIRAIYESGFSRIPVYEGDKQTIAGLLYVRDLAFVDADDEIPLTNILKFYNHEVKFVFDDAKLGEVLQEFSEGRCHMAIVQRVNSETESDPFYEVVGVVTLEDIVEEILQREIVDETDRIMDNRTMKPRERKHINLEEFEGVAATPTLSSQQQLAVFQFLSSGVNPFKEDHISRNVLKRLLRKVVVQTISFEQSQQKDYCLFSAGTPASYFALILEGCMEVQIGKDGLSFESRSFSHFGAQGLLNATQSSGPLKEYLPDFTVQPVTDCQVLIITHRQYLAAHRAAKFERERQLSASQPTEKKAEAVPDVFKVEWERAETVDIECSMNTGSGLSPISRFLPKPDSQQKVHKKARGSRTADKQHLLSSSSSGTHTSSESSESEISVSQTRRRLYKSEPRPHPPSSPVEIEMEHLEGEGEGEGGSEGIGMAYVPSSGRTAAQWTSLSKQSSDV